MKNLKILKIISLISFLSIFIPSEKFEVPNVLLIIELLRGILSFEFVISNIIILSTVFIGFIFILNENKYKMTLGYFFTIVFLVRIIPFAQLHRYWVSILTLIMYFVIVFIIIFKSYRYENKKK